MAQNVMRLQNCVWGGKRLCFTRPIDFILKVNPFSGEAIVENSDLDIYVHAETYDDAARQTEQEIGYIWDEYILRQKAVDPPSREIASSLAKIVASYGELRT